MATRMCAQALKFAALGCCLVTAASAAEPKDVPKLEFAFEELVKLGGQIPVGKTGLGERAMVLISGGTFEGPGLKGTIMPGGWDWQLRRADGCLNIKADYMLKTDDGVIINVINQGNFCPPVAGAPPIPGRSVAIFEPPLGKYEWLAKSAFVGTIEPAIDQGGIRVRFYQVK